jgi:release factor glutamine methyltransferase
MSRTRGLSVSDLLRLAGDNFRSAGIEQPRREARLLMQHVLDWSAAELIAGENDVPQEGDVAEFAALCARRRTGEPLAHLTGSVHFCGLTLNCDSRALIPRPDSETLVEAALARLPGGLAKPKVADLGTGSGALILAILHNHPRSRGFGLDLSGEALELARENARITGLWRRVRWEQGPWESPSWEDADMVISNPPYIPRGDLAGLAREVRGFEPHLALDGGLDGLDAYRAIMPLARMRMKRGVWLVLEIGHDQGASVPELAEAIGFAEVSLLRDWGGRDRVVLARQP